MVDVVVSGGGRERGRARGLVWRLGLEARKRRISCVLCVLRRGSHLWLDQATCRGQLEQVVDGADRRPLALQASIPRSANAAGLASEQ